MHQPLSDEEGFTLLELLVSLAITASAAGLLGAAMWSGHAAWQRTERAVAGGESVAAAQTILRDRIGHLLSDATGEAANGLGPSVTPDAAGAATGFSFVGAAPQADQPSPPRRYFVQLDRAGRLDLDSVDARVASGRTRWRVSPLLDNVAAVQFAYYGARTPDEGARWWTGWPGTGDPPTLVRLRLRFGRGDVRRWPDLVIRPAVNVSATCRVSPDGGGCISA